MQMARLLCGWAAQALLPPRLTLPQVGGCR
jgi:hypothetical protein